MAPRPRTRSQSGASHNSTGSQTSLLGSPPLPTAMDLEAESISLDSSAEAEQLSFGSPSTAADEDSRISFSSNKGPVLPESDASFQRKLFIMQSDSCTGQIHALPHPRSGNPVLYLLDARTGNPFELMRLDRLFNSGSGDGQRSSIFCGNSVVADPGPMFLFLPVNPLFLALPFLQENASQSFISPEEFLHQSNGHQFPALQLLTSSEKLMEALKLAADWKENDGTVKFRFNPTLLLDWLKTKFHALEKSLKANVEGMAEEGHALKHQALGILSDYLPEPISQQLAQHLGIDEPKEAEKKLTRGIPTSSSRKRPLADPIGMLLATSPKVTTTPARKKMARTLAIASKGTQSLKAFFVPSPSLKKEEEQEQALDDEIKTVKEETPSMEEEPVGTKATN